MCRIFGYFNSTASPQQVRTVAALQRHGGPDGHGNVRDQRWGLANNRLAIVDLAGGRQPYDLAGAIQVVFNGEIYNHVELRDMLAARGHRFPDRCDGSILPALYAEFGDAFVDRLDGMYSIALVDLRGEPRLLLATDHAGMKPLYYHWNPADRSLRFASEIPALLGFGGVPATPWSPGLDSYLATKTPFGEQTMFAGVQVLPRAATMTCVLGAEPRVTHRPAPVPDQYLGDDAVAEVLRDRLDDEVGRLLVADVPATVITSGGLDSSLVTALAARHADRLHSFTIAYTGSWPADERHFAEQVAERAGTTHHLVEIDPRTFPDLIEDVVWHLGQPNADPITLSTQALFGAVHEAGFKVALSGDAADEVFGGYTRMRAATEAAAAGKPWLRDYLDALGVLPAARRHSLYTREYRAEVAAADAVPRAGIDLLATGSGTVLDRITAFELEYRLPAYHLRRVDHLSMASSVEVRLPFCQRSVVGLGRALPDRLRVRDGQVKRALYGAADGLLPEAVLNRPKQPFTLPVTAMLAPGWPLWDLARDVLAGPRLATAGQLDVGAVQDLFVTQAQRPDDTTALTIWALLVHEVWRDQFQRVPATALTEAALA